VKVGFRPEDTELVGPQDSGMPIHIDLVEELVYLAQLHGMGHAAAVAAANEWTQRLGVAARRDDEVQKLSLGNQQRVQLAAALVHDPQIPVLDEPYSGLDPGGGRRDEHGTAGQGRGRAARAVISAVGTPPSAAAVTVTSAGRGCITRLAARQVRRRHPIMVIRATGAPQNRSPAGSRACAGSGQPLPSPSIALLRVPVTAPRQTVRACRIGSPMCLCNARNAAMDALSSWPWYAQGVTSPRAPITPAGDLFQGSARAWRV
jgi:hypothetical protein